MGVLNGIHDRNISHLTEESIRYVSSAAGEVSHIMFATQNVHEGIKRGRLVSPITPRFDLYIF